MYKPSVPITKSPLVSCVKVDDAGLEQLCTIKIDLGSSFSGFFSKPTLGNVGVTSDRNLWLGGILPSLLATPPASIKIDVLELTWGDIGTELCGDPVILGGAGELWIANIGQNPLSVCTIEKQRRSAVYDLAFGGAILTHNQIITIKISATLDDAFYENPYPLELLILSNAGARWVTISPPANISKEEKDKLLDSLKSVKSLVCSERANSIWPPGEGHLPVYELFGGKLDFDAHLWNVIIGGGEKGDIIELQNLQGKPLVRAVPNSNGLISLSTLLFDNSKGSPEFKVIYAGVQENAELRNYVSSNEQKNVNIVHTALKEKSQIDAGSIIFQVDTNYVEATPASGVLTKDGLAVYNIEFTSHPQILYQFAADGCERMIAWCYGFLTWRDNKIRGFAMHGRQSNIMIQFDERIADVACFSSVTYILLETKCLICNAQMSVIHELKTDRCSQIAVAGRTLVIARYDGILLFELSNPTSPLKKGFYQRNNPRILNSRIESGNNILINDNSDSDILVDISDTQNPLQITNYVGAPWLSEFHRIGRTYIHLKLNSTIITLYDSMSNIS